VPVPQECFMNVNPKAPNQISVPAPASDPAATPKPPRLDTTVLPRYLCAGDADIRLSGWGQSRTGTVANLSLSGCCVKSDFEFTVGDQVEMLLEVDGMSFRVAGRVVHVPSSALAEKGKVRAAGMGIEFQKMSAGARRSLETLITELNSTRTSMDRRPANTRIRSFSQEVRG
jgi:Tfp pilus assembly protein PilZ